MVIKFLIRMRLQFQPILKVYLLILVVGHLSSCTDDPTAVVDTPGPLFEIEVSPPYLNLAIDSTHQFTAIGKDEDGHVLPDSIFSWSSSKELVASIEEDGLLEAHLLGVTYIRAMMGEVTSLPITVLIYEPVNSLEIFPPNIDLDFGTRDTLVAVVIDENGSEVSGLSLNWSSDNSSIVQVNNTGEVFGVSLGSTTVSASLRGLRSEPITINVRPTLPIVTTDSIADITPRSVQVSGHVIYQIGNAYPDEYGICWSTEEEPTKEDHFIASDQGNIVFSLEAAVLSVGTTYYVRAYAINGRGTGYGDTFSFTTTTYETGSTTDIDGNIYQTIRIGDQWWLADNLRVVHYRNGDPISTGFGDETWGSLTTEGYCVYDNDAAYVETYGYLYNWYVIEDNRNVAPEGWHIPSDEEWMQLESYLGMEQSAVNSMGFRGTDEGRKLKSTSGWKSGRNGTNSSGFNAKPAGYRSALTGIFMGERNYTEYWTSSLNENQLPIRRHVDGFLNEISRFQTDPSSGLSIRCVMD